MRTVLVMLAAILLFTPPVLGREKKETSKSLKKKYARAMAVEDYDAAQEALEALGALDDKKVAKTLLGLALNKRVDMVTFEGAKLGLGAIRNEKSIDELVKIASKPKGSWEPRALAAIAFATIESDKVIPGLVKLLEDPNAVVRREAALACAQKTDHRILKALVTMYKNTVTDRGRDFLACRDSLIELTGNAYATVEAWEGFIEEKGDSFDFENDRGSDAGSTISSAEAKEQEKFFGREILTSRVVFVIDTSGSMKMWDANAEFPEENHKIGRPPKERVRMTRTKKELVRVLGTLDEYVQFNVVGFSSSVKRWQQGLVPATRANLKAAQAFVERMRADGGTNTEGALKEAFKYQDVDTIYLLSDGAPSMTGNDRKDAELREKLIRDTTFNNRFRKVVIYALGFAGEGVWSKEFGQKPDDHAEKVAQFIRFMRDLANDNEGDFISIP